MISFNDISYQWEETVDGGPRRLVVVVRIPALTEAQREFVQGGLTPEIMGVFRAVDNLGGA